MNLAIGMLFSRESESLSDIADVEVSLTEIALGVVKPWAPEGSITPYVGGGVEWGFVEKEYETLNQFTGAITRDDQTDSSPGLYIQAGFFARLGDEFNLGLEFRLVLGTDIEVFDRDGDVDYFQTGILLGWGS